MPKPYSGDLRDRVIEEIVTGASRREAAERYGISASLVVIWVQRFAETGPLLGPLGIRALTCVRAQL
jgi:transposase